MVKEIYTSGLKYKLIFTDFDMPIMDGIISTSKIRNYLENELKIEKEN